MVNLGENGLLGVLEEGSELLSGGQRDAVSGADRGRWLCRPKNSYDLGLLGGSY